MEIAQLKYLLNLMKGRNSELVYLAWNSYCLSLYWSDAQYSDVIIDEGICSSSQLEHGCHSIYGLSKRNFGLSPFMNTTTPLVRLCAKREVNNSFYDNASIDDGCPPNTLKCGDEPNYFWCSTDIKCPIFGVGFAYSKETIPEGAEITTIGSNKYFWLIRSNANQLPIVEFRIVEGPGVCMLNHDLAITPGPSDYILMKQYKTECKEIDPRFEVIQSIDEYSYYLLNNALDIPKTLDKYIISPKYTWALYGRNYMHWKQICRGQRFTHFKDQKDILDDIDERYTQALYLCGAYVFAASVGEDHYILALIIEVVLKLIFWIFEAYYLISTFLQVRNEHVYFNDLLGQDCSDEVTQITLTNLSNIIQLQVYQIWLARIIIFFIHTVIVACVILFYFFKYLFQRIKKYYKLRQVQEDHQSQVNQETQILNDKKMEQLDFYQGLDQMPEDQNNRF